MAPHADPRITIRVVGGADRAQLVRLAERDSAPPPSGTSLGAWVDGELVAARSLRSDRAVADPFRPTRQVAALLERRAKQVRGEGGRRRRSPFRRRSRAALPGSPPGAGGRTLVLDEC